MKTGVLLQALNSYPNHVDLTIIRRDEYKGLNSQPRHRDRSRPRCFINTSSDFHGNN